MRKILFYAGAALLALPALAAGPQKAGNWQTTIEVDIPGMPMKMPPVTTTVCLTKEDVETPQKSLPKASRDSNCAVSDYKTEGNTVSWKVKCEGKTPMTGSGEMTFDGDSYTGSMHLKMAEDREMSMKYSGKWLGTCEK